MVFAVKLTKKLSPKQFIISNLLLLSLGLIILAGLYYILNIQYKHSDKLFSNGPVTSPPKSLRLDLDQPEDDSLTFQSSIIVSGKTGPNMEVLISQDNQDIVIKSKSDGNFSTLINLDEGVNNIKVITFDQTGDSRFTQRVVYFSKEKL